ncbi:SURF1 family protein [Vallicoccus soli]|uniref:SURF1 family protein n=1 Tax=Vallicoccus soli TaxID=2339232 RepID=UPI0014028530|nr:SURF1 family protein [Vallicoccus soli]
MLLAPRWLALHALLVVAVTTCAVLGWWQWRAFRAESVAQPVAPAAARPIAEVLGPATPLDGTTAGQRVAVEGTYDPAEQLVVPGRELDGRVGVHVVTPLRTADGVVVVRRGWAPSAQDPAAAVPRGEVRLTGVLHPSEDRALDATRGARPGPGEVPVLTTTELHVALPYAPRELYDGFLELTTQDPPPRLALVTSEPQFASGGAGRWQNLSYVGQWWVFGLAAVGFWLAFVRSALRTRREELEDAAYEEWSRRPDGGRAATG